MNGLFRKIRGLFGSPPGADTHPGLTTSDPRPCPITGQSGDGLTILGSVPVTHENLSPMSEFRLVHSSYSDLIYLDPLPSPEQLVSMYEQSTQFDGEHYLEPAQVAAIMDYYGHCLETLFPKTSTPLRVLEVGAGLAWISRAAKAADPQSLTIAQDVSDEVAEDCEWVDEYLVGPVEEVLSGSELQFDVISMTHVIEHLAAPSEMMQALSGLLSADGIMFITAPYRPIGWQVGDPIDKWLDYSYLHVPAHITYFSKQAFELAVEPIGLLVQHWNQNADNGEAFELVLSKR